MSHTCLKCGAQVGEEQWCPVCQTCRQCCTCHIVVGARGQNHDPLPPEEPPSISPSPEPVIPNPEVPEIVPEIEPSPAPEAPPISPTPNETG